MSRLWPFLFGIVVGIVLLHTAMTYHIVRATDGFHVVAKSPARLAQSYVDIRGFGFSDWSGHPQLASALVQSNKQHLLGDSAVTSLQQSVNSLLPDTRHQ
jgi:hypothetical protein